MPLDNADVIDLVSISADGRTITLHLVATVPWPPDGAGLPFLQAKLKNYVAFAADGQLLRQYPEARGKNVAIEIRSDYALGALEMKLVEAAREHWCKPDGISLLISAGRRS